MENYQIKLIIAQFHVSIIQGGFQYKLNNGACKSIPYPTVEVKHKFTTQNEPKRSHGTHNLQQRLTTKSGRF